MKRVDNGSMARHKRNFSNVGFDHLGKKSGTGLTTLALNVGGGGGVGGGVGKVDEQD